MQGRTQIHHLQLHRTAAAELIDLQIKCHIHPLPRLTGALLGGNGKEDALQLHGALGKAQLEMAVLPHALDPVQRDAQQAEQGTAVAAPIRLQPAQLLHLP